MRVAVYARVSTEDRGQDPENQLAQLRAWCAAAGHEIAAEYIDHASGGKGADRRPRFTAMLDDAHRRRFDMVLVWALDRLMREGMVATVGYLQRLAAAGVAFHSYSEPAYAATTRWCGISCSRSWPRWRRRSAPGSASAPGRDWRECGRGGRGWGRRRSMARCGQGSRVGGTQQPRHDRLRHRQGRGVRC
jgi:hypothetical protein